MHRLMLAAGLIVTTTFGLVGCSSEPTKPKDNLSDDDKQQVEDLHKQRADEWGSTPKGGKR